MKIKTIAPITPYPRKVSQAPYVQIPELEGSEDGEVSAMCAQFY